VYEFFTKAAEQSRVSSNWFSHYHALLRIDSEFLLVMSYFLKDWLEVGTEDRITPFSKYEFHWKRSSQCLTL